MILALCFILQGVILPNGALINNTRQNDIQHNFTQQNDTLLNSTQKNDTKNGTKWNYPSFIKNDCWVCVILHSVILKLCCVILHSVILKLCCVILLCDSGNNAHRMFFSRITILGVSFGIVSICYSAECCGTITVFWDHCYQFWPHQTID